MNKYLVTGANGRIGRPLCVSLVALGHEIIAIERHGIIPHSDIKNDSITWFECDLRERSGIESLATQLSEQNIMLDGLVHSAAIVGDSNLGGFVTNLEELSEEACLAAFNINTLSFPLIGWHFTFPIGHRTHPLAVSSRMNDARRRD